MNAPAAIAGPDQLPLYADLPDHAAERDRRGIAIDRVGIRGLRYPISVRDRRSELQATVADVSMSVGLPADAKGTHMSRFVEILNARRGEITVRNLPELLVEMQRKLGADEAQIELRFPYFVEKEAPVSGARSLMEYRCAFVAEADGPEQRFRLDVGVPVTSLCPCSKAISAYGAHNQRSTVEVELESDRFVWIEDVITAVEACASSPLWALLKREDEKYVTELAYDNPRFVEDLVREVLIAVRALPGVNRVVVRASNQESIHNHDAFGELSWVRGEDATQVALGFEPPREQTTPFGVWLRAQREARGLGQGELAERLGCSTSFLSRVESGAKNLGSQHFDALAAALGQDALVLRLRAGVVPEELVGRIRSDPEAFLRWAQFTG